jgi:hypothetical protein
VSQWEFDVIDKMTNPLQAMGVNLDNFEHKLKDATKELDRLERTAKVDEISKMTDPMKRQIATLQLYKSDLEKVAEAQKKAEESGHGLKDLFGEKAFFAFEMGEHFLHLAEGVAHSAAEFVHWTAEAAQFRNGALATFELMLNGKEAALEEFEALEQIVEGSAMTKQEVMAQYKELFSFTDRYGAKATEDVLAAGADIQKALGAGAQSAFLGVMRNIEAMGGLNERTIRQLRETGIATPQRMYEALAAQLHTTTKGAEAMLKAHKISSETSINTLLKLVQDRIDRGAPLGEFSLERSKGNLDDQIKNLKESFEGIFQELDTKPAAHAIEEFAKAFGPSTEAGKELRDIGKQTFEVITAAIDYSREHMHGWIEDARIALHVVEALMKVPAFVFKAAFHAGEAVASVVTGDAFTSRTAKNDAQADKDQASINEMNARIEKLQAATAAKVESNTQLEAAMKKSGIDAGSGFVEGLARSLEGGQVPDVIHQYVTNEVDRALDAHSPSRVMMKRGGWAAEGLNIGFRDEMRRGGAFGSGFGVGTNTGFGMGATQMPAQSFGGSVGGTLRVDVSGTIKLEGSVGGGSQDLAAIGGQFEEIANRAIQRAFESLGHSN